MNNQYCIWFFYNGFGVRDGFEIDLVKNWFNNTTFEFMTIASYNEDRIGKSTQLHFTSSNIVGALFE